MCKAVCRSELIVENRYEGHHLLERRGSSIPRRGSSAKRTGRDSPVARDGQRRRSR